jgi:hypothetical protein
MGFEVAKAIVLSGISGLAGLGAITLFLLFYKGGILTFDVEKIDELFSSKKEKQ